MSPDTFLKVVIAVQVVLVVALLFALAGRSRGGAVLVAALLTAAIVIGPNLLLGMTR